MRRVIVPPSLALSRWSRSFAAFALLLLITTFTLHRIFGMPTAVALNLAMVAYIIAALALVLAFLGGYAIWRSGAAGTGNVAVGAVIAIAILLAPPLILQAASNSPAINDVTTDFARPPPFQSVSGLRSSGANSVKYPGDRFAKMQQEFYPDLKPMVVNRSAPEAFALVVDALKRENLTIVREDPPSEDGDAPGFLEALDRTLVFGFYDDVAIRVADIGDSARVDFRSASRFGKHDLGRNADRLRTLMRQVVVRLEETVQAVPDENTNKKKITPEKSQRPSQASARKSRARARARARRAQERKERRRQRPLEVPNYISPMPGY